MPKSSFTIRAELPPATAKRIAAEILRRGIKHAVVVFRPTDTPVIREATPEELATVVEE
jgi:hypothetical protein